MHLPSLVGDAPPNPPDPPCFPQPRSLAGSPKSALLVEDAECLSSLSRRHLEGEGYAVRTACSTEEGFRLYREFGPFNVVLINYFVPKREGMTIDPLEPQTHGIELALAIRAVNSAQGMIVAAVSFRTASDVPRPSEAADIPLLVHLSLSQLRPLLEKIEVNRAINALTSAELLGLQQFGKSLIRVLGRAARGKDWEDLLGEALYRSLIGAGDPHSGRHWNRKIPFVQHLAGAMRSIASVWKRQGREQNTYLISELAVCDSEGQEHSPLDNVPSLLAPIDQHLIEKANEDRILAMFEDNSLAASVARGWIDGLTKGEIMEKYALTRQRYAAIVKRIRLKLAAQEN
jgi:CheY-like chemotaxis protein